MGKWLKENKYKIILFHIKLLLQSMFYFIKYKSVFYGQVGRLFWWNLTLSSEYIFKWFIPVVCDYNIKYQKISGGWVKTQHFITV